MPKIPNTSETEQAQDLDSELYREPALGRTLEEQLIISFIRANPTAEEDKMDEKQRLVSQRSRLAAGMSALFGKPLETNRREIPDDVLLYNVASIYLDRNQSKHKRASGKPLTLTTILKDEIKKFYPAGEYGENQREAVRERVRKKLREKKDEWIRAAQVKDFVTETVNYQVLEKIRDLLADYGIAMIPTKWSDSI